MEAKDKGGTNEPLENLMVVEAMVAVEALVPVEALVAAEEKEPVGKLTTHVEVRAICLQNEPEDKSAKTVRPLARIILFSS